jgi:hypothetical protein
LDDLLVELESPLSKRDEEFLFQIPTPKVGIGNENIEGTIKCFRKVTFTAPLDGLQGMNGLFFHFQLTNAREGEFDYRRQHDEKTWVHVPYFDELFRRISESGNPIASVIFGKSWLCILRPENEMPADIRRWAWEVLRDGFNIWPEK